MSLKKYLWKSGIICGYLLLIAGFVGFRPEMLFNLKEILLVVIGCVVLTLPYGKEGKKRREILEIAGNNGLISSYLVTFVLILSRVNEMVPDETLLRAILLSCRPVLYGFFLLLLLKRPEEKEASHSGPEASIGKEGSEEKKDIELLCQEAGLTARETQIVKLVILGLSNREIAESLYIAESTVKKHLSNVFEKLEVANREQLKQLFFKG